MLLVEQIALLALRALTGLVFVWSGSSHARDPKEDPKTSACRSQSCSLVGVVEC